MMSASEPSLPLADCLVKMLQIPLPVNENRYPALAGGISGFAAAICLSYHPQSTASQPSSSIPITRKRFAKTGVDMYLIIHQCIPLVLLLALRYQYGTNTVAIR